MSENEYVSLVLRRKVIAGNEERLSWIDLGLKARTLEPGPIKDRLRQEGPLWPVAMAYQRRLKKEYEEMSKRAPVGITLHEETMEDNIDT